MKRGKRSGEIERRKGGKGIDVPPPTTATRSGGEDDESDIGRVGQACSLVREERERPRASDPLFFLLHNSMTSIPAHILSLLTPLHSPSTTFTLSPSTNLISPSSSPQTQYLYKSSPLSSPSAIQIKGEAESLRCMNLALEGIVPRLIGTGEEEGEKWMLSEWHSAFLSPCYTRIQADNEDLELSPLNAEQQRELGSLVAKMHLSLRKFNLSRIDSGSLL